MVIDVAEQHTKELNKSVKKTKVLIHNKIRPFSATEECTAERAVLISLFG